MCVLVHAELVQLLAGNAVMAKTPTQGGAACLTLAHALMARAGPAGHAALRRRRGAVRARWSARRRSARWPSSAAGPTAARSAARARSTPASGTCSSRRASTPGASGSSPTGTRLAAHLKKGFEYGKQRCTAYPRFVVQRELVDQFLAMYLPVRAVASGSATRWPSTTDDDPLPDAGLRPGDQRGQGRGARRQGRRGAAPRRGAAATAGRSPTAASCPARTPPPTSRRSPCSPRPAPRRLMHAEPFGPVDTIVVVDTEAELLAADERLQRRAGASIACDDEEHAAAHRPSRCRRSRSASTSRARAATATSPSAAAAPPGRAPSSAATCWSRP